MASNAQKQKTQQDLIAKQKAKDAVAAKKEERKEELDKPLTEEEAKAVAAEKGEGDSPTEDSVASLAAKGLQDGGSLNDDEVQRVSGAVLSKADDVDAAKEAEDGQDDTDEEKGQAAVTLEQFAALEARIDRIEKMVARIGRDAGVKVPDGSQFGLIDKLKA